MADQLTHVDRAGHANMVDVSDKDSTARQAVACGHVSMQPATLALLVAGGHHKGDVFACARIAGIQAAKQCSQLIPLCHPLMLTGITVELSANEPAARVDILASCRVQGQTGVEMEALTAVSVAALTIYDMCKAMDRGMEISGIRLLRKQGGRSGEWFAEGPT